MWVQIINNKLAIYAVCAVLACQLMACADCEKFNRQNVLPRQGNIVIDTIYLKWGERAYTAANIRTGAILLFNESDFPIQPKVGDSLVKKKGEAEYTLYTEDSVYVQKFDCAKGHGIIVSSAKRD